MERSGHPQHTGAEVSEEQQLSFGEDGHVNQRYFCFPTSHLFYLSIISDSIISKCRV